MNPTSKLLYPLAQVSYPTCNIFYSLPQHVKLGVPVRRYFPLTPAESLIFALQRGGPIYHPANLSGNLLESLPLALHHMRKTLNRAFRRL